MSRLPVPRRVVVILEGESLVNDAPRLVLYDPELTYELSAGVSAASGMNAIAHCIEAEYAPERSPVTSWFAMEGLRRLAASLPVVVQSPHDPAARSDALFGAHLAGRALDMRSMGLEHKLAHVLGGRFGLNRAEAHAALAPWVAAWNAQAAPEAMARIALALGTDDAARALVELSRRLGIRPLRELGFSADGIPEAAGLIANEARDGWNLGHRAFKIKVGRGARHMPLEAGTVRDMAVIHAVREAVDVPGTQAGVLQRRAGGVERELAKGLVGTT